MNFNLDKLQKANQNSTQLNDKILLEKKQMIDKYDELFNNFKKLENENKSLKLDYEDESKYFITYHSKTT